jgi:hypothetical protein
VIGKVGDTIVIEPERFDAVARRGVIEDVLEGERPRYQVRWQDGRISIFAPAAGGARIEPKKTRAKKKA